MGLRDRLTKLVASLFSPSMDHPARGGMTGDPKQDDGTPEGEEGTATDEQ